MCDSPIEAWLVKSPKMYLGNFLIRTRQYNEIVQNNKEYILIKSDRNYKITQKFNSVQTVYLPCGKCIQCLKTRSDNWTIRSSLELQKYDLACCLTLTYRDLDLPADSLIQYKDVQLFLKKLRNHLSKTVSKDYKIKFMCCCEYGKKNLRPHYHIIIFNYFPTDIKRIGGKLVPYKRTKKGTCLYKSDFLTNLWSHGFVDVGLVNHQTCRYVSQYCCKKLIHTDRKYLEKIKIKKEKLVASVGFGLDWFKKNYRSVINSGRIVLGGFKFSIPRYFVKKLEQINLKLYNSYKELLHLHFVTYVFDDEERRKQQARSDLIYGRLKLFHDVNVSDDYLLDNLHNI